MEQSFIYLLQKGKSPLIWGQVSPLFAPVSAVLADYTGGDGYSYALGGFFAVGVVLSLVAFIIKFVGTRWIDVIFPPAAMGAIVSVIGLEDQFLLQQKWPVGLLLLVQISHGQ